MANISYGVNILPKINNTYTLGNSSYKWHAYLASINGQAIEELVLPAVTSSDNDKILKVSSGAWTVDDAPSGLPSVSSTDNGKILSVSSGEWAATTPNYLTSHQDISGKANIADLATVATSGSYNDLSNKPDLSIYLTSVPTMTGATSSAAGTTGLVPAPGTGDVDKFLAGDGTYKSGGKPMVILSYGSSTWNDFINAYNSNVIVYCRASSNSNPANGSQTRMAFMAYVNNATSPTNVEFQYYRSVNPTQKSASQMSDQVFVYTLTNSNGGTWSVTTRQAGIQSIAAASGSKIGVSYSNSAVTLSNTITADDMPMSSSDATTAKAAIDSLNSKIATKSTTATLASGWSVGSNQNIIYKSGDVVSLCLWANGGTITQSSWNLIATIPSGYKPSSSVDFLGINNSNDKAVHCQITNDGRILVYGSADAGSDLRLTVTYFAG